MIVLEERIIVVDFKPLTNQPTNQSINQSIDRSMYFAICEVRTMHHETYKFRTVQFRNL